MSFEIIKNKILVIDDEKMIVRLLRRFFEMHRVTSFYATKVDEALKILNKHEDEIALIICDYHLDNDSGFYMIKTWNDIHGQIPCLLMSGDPTVADEIKNNVKYNVLFLQKPFNLLELTEALSVQGFSLK